MYFRRLVTVRLVISNGVGGDTEKHLHLLHLGNNNRLARYFERGVDSVP